MRLLRGMATTVSNTENSFCGSEVLRGDHVTASRPAHSSSTYMASREQRIVEVLTGSVLQRHPAYSKACRLAYSKTYKYPSMHAWLKKAAHHVSSALLKRSPAVTLSRGNTVVLCPSRNASSVMLTPLTGVRLCSSDVSRPLSESQSRKALHLHACRAVTAVWNCVRVRSSLPAVSCIAKHFGEHATAAMPMKTDT